jgi:hypothetical protein
MTYVVHVALDVYLWVISGARAERHMKNEPVCNFDTEMLFVPFQTSQQRVYCTLYHSTSLQSERAHDEAKMVRLPSGGCRVAVKDGTTNAVDSPLLPIQRPIVPHI